MFQSHPNLVKPEPSAKLWRYTDFAKFLFLLERRALWFSRLDTLGDPYEGMPPRPFIEDVWTAATTAPEAERAARIEMANQNTHAFTMGRDILAVSCWHVGAVESAAMWSLYARLGEGIAISTSLELLERSVPDEQRVYGGLVNYVDFESHRPAEPLNVFDWATLKRTSFSHEGEFRAMVFGKTGPLRAGVAVPVALDTLIEVVHVSPAAEPWWVDVVRDVCLRYGISAEVRQSDLLRHPAYMSERTGSIPPIGKSNDERPATRARKARVKSRKRARTARG